MEGDLERGDEHLGCCLSISVAKSRTPLATIFASYLHSPASFMLIADEMNRHHSTYFGSGVLQILGSVIWINSSEHAPTLVY